MKSDGQIGSVIEFLTPENKKRYLKWLHSAYDVVSGNK